MAPPTLTGTPADLITYQRELVRTHDYIPLGRITKIAIAPSADWFPPANDPVIAKFGRLMQFHSSRLLPIAQSRDLTQLLVPAPMFCKQDRSVGLPDWPDPGWRAEPWTNAEQGYDNEGKPLMRDGKQYHEPRPLEKDQVRMLPQRLEDRCERPNGRLGKLEGTNFLVFQPVINVVFQPEKDRQLQAQNWVIEAQFDPGTQTHMSLLVDPQTGETIFFGGRYDLVANEG
jgi:hypothetical protein